MAKKPNWTPEEDERLAEMLEANRSYRQIAQALGRTETAIILRCKRHLKLRLTTVGGMTALAVARLMGVEVDAVLWWSAQGWLRARRYPVRRVMWRIEEEDLISFLEDERYWHVWQPERITDHGWREWTGEMRACVRFVGTREAGEMLGYHEATVTGWIARRLLLARKHGPNWRIREVDLLTFKVPDRSGKVHLRRFTAEEDGRLWRMIENGVSYTATARELGRSINSVHQRYWRLRAKARQEVLL